MSYNDDKEFYKLSLDQSLLLNFMRGGAALLVLLAHCQQIWVNPYWYPHKNLDVDLQWILYRHLGSFGVMIFFVLSGFLIYLSLSNNIKNSPGKQFDIMQFAISRFIRLYPPLVISLIICAVLYCLLDFLNLNESSEFATGKELYLARKEVSINVVDMLGSLFFLNTIIDSVKSPSINGPLWSLAHEFWFYVVAALIVYSYKIKKSLILLTLVVFFLYKNVDEFWFYGFVVWVGGFYSAWSFHNRSLAIVRWTNVVLAIILGGFWIYMVVNSANSYYFNNRQKFLFGLCLATLLPILLAKENILKKIAAFWCYRIIASVSPYAYTLYLIHFPILLFSFLLLNRMLGGNLFFICAAIILLAAQIILLSAFLGGKLENKVTLKKYVVYCRSKCGVAI